MVSLFLFAALLLVPRMEACLPKNLMNVGANAGRSAIKPEDVRDAEAACCEALFVSDEMGHAESAPYALPTEW